MQRRPQHYRAGEVDLPQHGQIASLARWRGLFLVGGHTGGLSKMANPMLRRPQHYRAGEAVYRWARPEMLRGPLI